MGAHPDLPSKIEVKGRPVALNEFVTASAEEILGPAFTREFEGQLPYLFKVLSAGAPLSIQTHPTKERAREGFTREDAAGIPRYAGQRNNPDTNHKHAETTMIDLIYIIFGSLSQNVCLQNP